jgi:hypothetical protein
MDALGSNLIAWMAQTTLLAAAGAALPLLFRLRHPRTQLAYGHAVVAACSCRSCSLGSIAWQSRNPAPRSLPS